MRKRRWREEERKRCSCLSYLLNSAALAQARRYLSSLSRCVGGCFQAWSSWLSGCQQLSKCRLLALPCTRWSASRVSILPLLPDGRPFSEASSLHCPVTEVLCGSCHWAGVCRTFLLDSCHLGSHNWSVSLQGQQLFMSWSHWGKQWQNGWWTGLLGWSDKNRFGMSPAWTGPQVWHVGQALTCLQGGLSLYVGTAWDAPCYCSFSGFISGKWSQQVLPEPWRQKSIHPYRRLLEEKSFKFLDSPSSLQWGEAFLCCPASTSCRRQVNKEK